MINDNTDGGRNRFPETCEACGSRFKILKKRGPTDDDFGWNYCPHCGTSLRPEYSCLNDGGGATQ